MNLNGLKWCLNDFNWFIRYIESHLESYWVFWSHKSPEASKIVLVCNTHCDVQFWWGLIKEIQDCVYEKLCLTKLPRPPGVRRVIYVSSVKNRLKKMIKKVNVSLNCAFSIKYEHKFVVYIGAEEWRPIEMKFFVLLQIQEYFYLGNEMSKWYSNTYEVFGLMMK